MLNVRGVTGPAGGTAAAAVARNSPAGAIDGTWSTVADGKATRSERIGRTGNAAFGPQSVHIGGVSMASSTTVHIVCLPDAVVIRRTLSTDAAAIASNTARIADSMRTRSITALPVSGCAP